MTGDHSETRPKDGPDRTRRVLAVIGLSLVVAAIVAIPVALRVAEDDPAPPAPTPSIDDARTTTSTSASTTVPTQVLGTSETNPDPGP